MKNNKTTPQEIEAWIEELLSEKAVDIANAEKCKREAETKIEQAQATIYDAIMVTDKRMYSTGIKAKMEASGERDMYAARIKQLRELDFVTDQDSTKAVDALLSFGRERTQRFEEEITEHISAMDTILTSYNQDIADANRILRRWLTEIHADHRQDIIKEDGSRIPSPTPLRIEPCLKARFLRSSLDKLSSR